MTSSGNIEPEIKQTLEMLGITYTWIVVDPDFADTENFCRKYDYPMEKSGNTILVASKRGEKKYCACIVLATAKLDVNKKVKELMGVSRLSFANTEETIHLTGMMIGGVTPIGLPDTLPVFIDSDVMTIDYVIIGGGSRSGKIQVNPQELLKLPNSKVVQGLSKT
jgi:prolyl-tRNA editing enzyme YbaK/EbsC (Cys-tRNA(Pro) deacylase)|tara:strand:- start:184 stop:678 length:495 start_codon:yes stop_codon:yes gene_type:complete